MTLDEFRAWLRGYQESFGEDGPTAEQWEKVIKELAEVEAVEAAPIITYPPVTGPWFGIYPPWREGYTWITSPPYVDRTEISWRNAAGGAAPVGCGLRNAGCGAWSVERGARGTGP